MALPAASIVDLPTNILALCLNPLDAKELLNCRKVCSAFRSLVDTDAQLRYNIELHTSNMIDGLGSVAPPGSRVDSLLEHERRWRRCEWTATRSLPYPLLPMSDGTEANEVPAAILTRGTLCCAFLFQDYYFRFFQLPSHVRGLEYHEWDIVFPQRRNKTVDIDFDPSQDIMILLETPENSYERHLSVLGLRDGLPHPLASRALLATYTSGGAPRIFGSYVTFFIKAEAIYNLQCRLDIFNWKTGFRVRTIWRDYVVAITFISERYMLLVEHTRTHPPLRLTIVDIHNVGSLFVCCLLLPNMPRRGAGSYAANHIDVQSGLPMTVPSNSRAHFATDAANQLVLVTFALYEREAFALFTLASRLVELAERYQGNTETLIIPWEEWGPENTRIIDTPPRSSVDLHVYGTKAVIVDGDMQWLYDFNQRSINRELSRSASDEVPEDIVVATTELVERSTFSDTVTTCLPYRITGFALEGFDLMTDPIIHVGEDSIVCVPGNAEQDIVISSI